MSQQPVEANVVLGADVSDYQRSMGQAAQSTDELDSSLSRLGKSIDSVVKTAGKMSLGISAATVAGITAAAAAYASFDSQMSSLNAQAGSLSTTMQRQDQIIAGYTRSVNGLRREFGSSLGEATQLTQAVAKMGDGTKSIENLSRTFTQMSVATGESSQGLARGLLQLQKTMGSPQKDTEKYANMMTSLASSTNASASEIINFAQQIAPVGRMLGMTTTEVSGVSTAFLRAGQDGMQAATVFNKMMSDIGRAKETGSPMLANYANILGMDTESFSKMSGAEQITKIFEKLNTQGDQAISTLNTLGLDGSRSIRSISAVMQNGGFRTAIEDAERGSKSNASGRGAEAAMSGLHDEFSKMKQEVMMSAEAMGKVFAPALEAVVGGMEKFLSIIRAVAESPLGQMISMLGGAAAPVLATAGALALMAKSLLGVAGVVGILRNSGGLAILDGFRGNSGLGGPNMSRTGAAIHERGNFVNRGLYSGGHMAGAAAGGAYRGVTGWWGSIGRGNDGSPSRPGGFTRNPNSWLPATSAAWQRQGNTFGQRLGNTMMNPVDWSNRNILRNFLAPISVGSNWDVTQRPRVFNESSVGNYRPFQRMGEWTQRMGERAGVAAPRAYASMLGDRTPGMHGPQTQDQAARAARVTAQTAETERVARQTREFGNQMSRATSEAGRFSSVLGRIAGAGAYAGGQFASAAAGTIGMAGRAAAPLAMRAGSAVAGALGGPVAAAMLGGMALYGVHRGITGDDDYVSNNTGDFSNPYYAATGGESLGTRRSRNWVGEVSEETGEMTKRDAYVLNSREQLGARAQNYQLTNESIKGLDYNDAIIRLKSQWSDMSSDPARIHLAMMDIANQYGVNRAEQAAESLQGFEGGEGDLLERPDLSALAKQARNPGSKGKNDKFFGIQSKSLSLDKLATAYSSIDDFAAQVEAIEGIDAAVKYREDAIDQFVKDFASTGGKKMSWRNEETNDAFSQEFAKNVLGFSKDFGGFEKGSEPIWKMSEADSADSMIRKMLNPGDAGTGYGFRMKSDELKQLQEIWDIKPGTSGANTAEQIIEKRKEIAEQEREEVTKDLGDRIGELSDATALFAGNADVIEATLRTDSSNAQYKGMDAAVGIMSSLPGFKGVTELGNIMSTSVSSDDPSFRIAQAAQQRLLHNAQIQQNFQTRTQNDTQQGDLFRATTAVKPGSESYEQDMANARGGMEEWLLDRYNHVKGLVVQQREFDVSRERSEEDYNQQREWSDTDFTLQRERSEFEFNLSRKQSQADFDQQRKWGEADHQRQKERNSYTFNRSMKRSEDDYRRSRLRQEEDYQHQVMRMHEQSAKSVSNIYERINVQRTNSAAYLLVNNQDQVRRMQEQSQNLDYLRNQGISDQTINQLGLTDSQNAQQLARFVTDIANDPTLVQQFNNAVKERIASATDLTTDESSVAWQDFQRQYKLQVDRADDDFKRTMRRSRKDFKEQMEWYEEDYQRSIERQIKQFEKQMARQEKAFSRSMKNASDDYDKSMDRMQTQYDKSLERATADLDRAQEEVTGSFQEMMEKGVEVLGENGANQARSALSVISGLGKDITKEGTSIMKDLSKVFGFEYNVKTKKINFSEPSWSSRGRQTMEAQGGVLPGRSIGHDDMHFYSPVHGNLHLAGGEAIMVPEWVDAVGGPGEIQKMNLAARSGGKAFSQGGVVPAPGEWNQHTSGYPKARWSGDINVPGAGDYGNPVKSWKAGVVADAQKWNDSYGWHVRVNHPETNEQTLYAHLSNILVKIGDTLSAGQRLGNVGSTGNSSGPHLHFEILGGTGPLNLGGGGGGDLSGLSGILKDSYPSIEKQAAKFNMGGGFKEGFWSDMLNSVATEFVSQIGGDAEMPSDRHGELRDTTTGSNQDIVKAAMKRHGYNQWAQLHELVMRESSFNHLAQNPTSTAFGLFQFLDSTWAGVGGKKTRDPYLQSEYGLRYIKNRYGDPASALSFHDKNNWYGHGSIFDGAQTIGVGERGPEMVLPLNDTGAQFIADIFAKTSVGAEERGRHTACHTAPVGGNSYTYNVDRSATFTGPIQVAANNPNELIARLQDRHRTGAMAQPILGGRR